MIRTVHSRCAVLVLCLRTVGFVVFTLAGIGSVAAQDEPDDIVVRADLIVVPFVVTDHQGQRTPGLTLNDFALTDNGRAMQPEFFAAGPAKTAIIFLWDQSDSVRDVVTGQQTAALGLLDRFGRDASVALMRFGVRPRMVVPFTSDREKLRAEFARTAPSEDRTAIFDAALVAVNAFQTRPHDLAERRIVVLLSDGLDNASSVKPRQVIDAARAAGVSFYLIYTPLYTARDNALVPRSPSSGFRDLAIKTGGQVSASPKGKAASAAALAGATAIDLGPLLQAIADDLNGQYFFAYYLNGDAKTTGLHHPEVTLSSTGRKGLTVRVLRGDFTLDNQPSTDH